MSNIAFALKLAAAGFHVFPLIPGTKKPLIAGFPTAASWDPQQIEHWAAKWPRANWGVSTSRFGDGEHLIAVDVDVKNGRNGYLSVLDLEIEGKAAPDVFSDYGDRGPSFGLPFDGASVVIGRKVRGRPRHPRAGRVHRRPGIPIGGRYL